MPEAVSWQMRDAILTAMLLELRHDHWELLTSLRRSGAKRLCDSTVTQVAADVGGFFHLGRFAREYLVMFGEHPSATLHRQVG
jgi:hypothetical protein